MATIRIVENASVPWFSKAEGEPEGYEEGDEVKLDRLETASPTRRSVRFHHEGNDEDLQLLELWFEPGEAIGSHAHLADEIIYVLEGEMIFGRRRLTPGSSVLVPGETLYSFRAGSDGLRFLNFRAHQDLTSLTREQFMALRATSPSPSSVQGNS
jgi:quercetin dioxygenase-like cupin family protein